MRERDFYRDAQRALLSLIAGPVALACLGLTVVVWFSYCAGQRTGKQSLQVAALRDTVRITDSVIVVRAETVTVRQNAVTRWDSIVRNVTDTQVVVLRDTLPPDTVVVPREVIAKDQAKDALIAGLYAKDSTQEWRIATRDKLYRVELAKANGPRWGYGTGVGIACTASGCGPAIEVSINYQAKFPDLRSLIRKAVR